MGVRSMIGAAALVFAVAGCFTRSGGSETMRPGVAVLPPERDVGTTKTGGVPRNTTADMPVFRKRVEAKEDPSILIARDKTRCSVNEERYRKIKVGDNVMCAWRTDL
jgi:hypothetical protein